MTFHRQLKKRQIVFCGRLYPSKGCDILLQAFYQFREISRFDYRVLIIGDGPEKHQLEIQAKILGIESSVEFVGVLPNHQVREILQASDICVIPSRREPFGLVAVEAMAETACVIASAVGGLKEIVQDSVNGWLVPPEDPIALCNAIQYVSEKPKIVQQVRKNALQTVKSRFDWNVIADATIEIYKKCLGKN